MNSMHLVHAFFPLKASPDLVSYARHSPSLSNLSSNYYSYFHHRHSHSVCFPFISLKYARPCQLLVSATSHSNEGTVSVVQFEDFVEKDWSFLDLENTNSDEEHRQKIDLIISAGDISETSKVLISIGSEAFVDRVVDTTPCKQLLIVHDSLLTLACIKEKYDNVKCWQGELINVPEKWTPFDVVFLYFLPGLPFELNVIVRALAQRCSPGARLVISFPQGRKMLEEQRLKYQDVVVSSLPEKIMLQSIAVDHSFEVVEFVDEPKFYLAVLQLSSKINI